MEQVFLPFLTAFLVSLLATPFTIKFARKYGLVDDPNLRPHPAHQNTRIIPQAGGIPIYLGILFSVLFFIPLTKSIIGIIVGISILLFVGLLDDYLKNFSPFPRLSFQFLAAIAAVAFGVGITFTTNPFGGILRFDQIILTFNFLGSHNLILFADLFALFWIVWMMNMVNWSNGVDGQTPAIVVVACATIGFLSLRLVSQGDSNQLPIALIAFITAGVSLSFLIFNWYPSKIIPGFGANTIWGFIIAVLSIFSGAKLATALIVLLVPSVDFFYTFFRRILAGRSPFYGDQKHLHHLLLKRGWSHQQVALFYFITSAILGFAVINLNSQEKLFTVIGVGTIVLGIIIWLHLFYKQPERV